MEYVVKEKNAKILQLEQEKLVQSVKLERLKERLAQMERLGGGGGSPLGGGADASSLAALQQKDGEMLALQTYATQGSNPGRAGRVPGRSCSATHTCAPRLGQAHPAHGGGGGEALCLRRPRLRHGSNPNPNPNPNPDPSPVWRALTLTLTLALCGVP